MTDLPNCYRCGRQPCECSYAPQLISLTARKTSMNVCFYHRSDLDGKCSGAIYATAMRERGEEFTLHGIDYGDEIPWDLIDGADLTVVDWSFQPWSQFCEAIRRAKSIRWIDHHRSAIAEWNKNDVVPNGAVMEVFLDERQAGCELAWKVLFPHKEMPFGVRLLGRYDVWDHRDPLTIPYQHGVRSAPNEPDEYQKTWRFVFADSETGAWTQETLARGRLLLDYQSRTDASAVAETWFPLHFAGYAWQACNRLGKGSAFFQSVWDGTEFDGMLSFGWHGQNRKWQIGLYSDRDGMDCGAIAKQHGGGGHPGAAGFLCDRLPFTLPPAS